MPRLLLLLAFVFVPVLHAQDVIAPTGRWVTDNADLLSPDEERALSEKLRTYADTTSTQIVVVTLPSLNGADAGQYATTLGHRWGVGQQGQDNGAVILVSRDDRKMFIATGYGLEGAIPDAIASRIVRNVMAPNFREGRFYQGLSEAVDALILAARGEYQAAPRARRQTEGPNMLSIIILIVIVVMFIRAAQRGGGGGKGGGGRRYRSSWGGPPVIIWGGGGGFGRGGGFGGGGFGGGGFGGGGFGGGGGGFGGGGAGGSW